MHKHYALFKMLSSVEHEKSIVIVGHDHIKRSSETQQVTDCCWMIETLLYQMEKEKKTTDERLFL